MKSGFILLLLVTVPASAGICSRQEAYAAEIVSDYIESWNKLRAAYKEFEHCDDGVVAEGFSDVVARLLTKQWVRLPELSTEIKQDASFGDFVLRHINGTWDMRVRKHVAALAASSCPVGESLLCEKISAALALAR